MKPKRLNVRRMLPLAMALCATAAGIAMETTQASSHREAPFIARRQLEVPMGCVTAGAEAVIGSWTTASLRQGRLLATAAGDVEEGLGLSTFTPAQPDDTAPESLL